MRVLPVIVIHCESNPLQRSNTISVKGIKFHSVKCIRCKAELFVRPTEEVCPVCGGTVPAKGRS